jgi:hypothetical protein
MIDTKKVIAWIWKEIEGKLINIIIKMVHKYTKIESLWHKWFTEWNICMATNRIIN